MMNRGLSARFLSTKCVVQTQIVSYEKLYRKVLTLLIVCQWWTTTVAPSSGQSKCVIYFLFQIRNLKNQFGYFWGKYLFYWRSLDIHSENPFQESILEIHSTGELCSCVKPVYLYLSTGTSLQCTSPVATSTVSQPVTFNILKTPTLDRF